MYACKEHICHICGKTATIKIENFEKRLRFLNKDLEIIDWGDVKNSLSKLPLSKRKFLVNSKKCDHKNFFTTMNKIQQGKGCPTCGNINSKNGERLTHNEIIEKLNSIEFFKYYDIYDSIH